MTKTGLIILDGWGHREQCHANAIALANTPNYDHLLKHSPHTFLDACGEAVGLPEKQMGNSEVGHLHIGAGRVIKQNLSLINESAKQQFADREGLITKLKFCRQQNSTLHILGLLSDGGVHSHEEHIFSLLRLSKRLGLTKIHLHIFTDGRDTPPNSCRQSIQKLETLLQKLSVGKITTLCGRYYAMDRDQRWERTQQAYQLIIQQTACHHADTAIQAIEQANKRGQSDEFIAPTLIANSPPPTSDDVFIMMNFRIDRMRQLTEALINPDFSSFNTQKTFSNILTLTQYHPNFNATVIFPPNYPQHCLGEQIAKAGLRQLRLAETEKYPHVTFFFNGGRDIQYDQEERQLIPSPKVTTYDKQPSMSAIPIKNHLIKAIQEEAMDFFVCNFANTDMVGHSGQLNATIEAAETVDKALGEICLTAKKNQWQLVITADHGNAEIMQDINTGEPHTAHTLSLVPFIIYNAPHSSHLKKEGSLVDIAPTLLNLLSQPIPSAMTGISLLELG